MCISHFSCFLVILVIFHYLTSVILIFRDFQFSRQIPAHTVCILIFHVFKRFRHFSSCQVDFLILHDFSFLVIFFVLKCVFPIFHDFQFSRHIPGPTVCISLFSHFSVISSFFKSSSGCFSFSMILVFLTYSTSYSGHF